MAIMILRTAWNQSPDIEVEVLQSAADTYMVNYGTDSRVLLASNLKDSTFDLVAWAESNFTDNDEDFDLSDVSSLELVPPNSSNSDMPDLEPVSDSESNMSDDETDMPALQSVSDSDSEFSHTEDEYEFEFPCSDSNDVEGENARCVGS
jgi:hypothetical protein